MNEHKAARYHRLKRRLGLLMLAWSVLVLAGLVWTGWTVVMREAAESFVARVAGGRLAPGATVVVYIVMLALINETGALPMAFYSGYVIERRYALSNQSAGAWAGDQAKAFALGLALGSSAAVVVYWLIRLSPERWWLAGGLVFAAFMVGLTNLAPILLMPLFYTIRPLTREPLRVRLLALAERAGARVSGAYEWGLAERTRRANAALAGIGRTRRVLVSDTMLAAYSDEEIEVVFAHELGHHLHGDIWKGLLFESLLILAGFYLASRLLAGLSPWAGLRDIADPAGLPLLLLAAGGASLLMRPIAQAMSRAHERRADRFALRLTGNPGAFVSAMRRLGAQNLAEDDPSKVVQWLFYSHPPVRERIAAAAAFTSGARCVLS